MTLENRDAKILAWNKAKQELAKAKAMEMELRKEVLKDGFDFDSDEREGTENLELGNGYKLKAVFKLSRKLNNEKEAVDKALTKIEKSGPEGAVLAERLVKWEPKLVKKEYDLLPNKFRKMIDEIVTSKPGTPTLALIEPKSK